MRSYDAIGDLERGFDAGYNAGLKVSEAKIEAAEQEGFYKGVAYMEKKLMKQLKELRELRLEKENNQNEKI